MVEILNKKDIEELRKKIEPIQKLAFHDDADGTSSAVLLSYIFKINRVWSPMEFGEWPIVPWTIEGKQELPPDVCVDMVPCNPAWEGLAIDHHPCLHEDTLIQTSSGKIMKVKDIADACISCLCNGVPVYAKVIKFDNGIANHFVKILTKNGNTIKTTFQHKFFDENWKERRACELKVGDKIRLAEKLPEGTLHIEPALARLLGYYYGVDSKTANENGYPRLRLYDKDLSILERYASISRTLFSTKSTIFPAKSNNGFYCVVDSKRFADTINDYLERFDEFDNECLSEFISGLYDAKGSDNIRHKDIRITNTDRMLLEKIRICLLRFSILSYISSQLRTKHKGRNPVTVYNLTVAESRSKERFLKLFRPFKHIRQEILTSPKYQNPFITSIGSIEIETKPARIFDFSSPEGKYIADIFVVHNSHPPEGQRNYQLIHGDSPTSVLVYTLFKSVLPKEQRWKMAVGAVGDGQPELIPPEIWRDFPILLEETVTSWERYGKIETTNFPLYLKLSSGINAACKLPDKWYLAYSVLRNAKSPWDLLKDSSLNKAKEIIEDERAKVYRETTPIQLRNSIRLWGFSSETKIERTISWEMWEKDKHTVVAINMSTGRGSIRGALATLVYEHLSQCGFQASGHPGFGGLRLKPEQTFEDLYQCLASLRL